MGAAGGGHAWLRGWLGGDDITRCLLAVVGADEEYKPSKVRIIHSGTSGTPIILPRRSYTWRGASRVSGRWGRLGAG